MSIRIAMILWKKVMWNGVTTIIFIWQTFDTAREALPEPVNLFNASMEYRIFVLTPCRCWTSNIDVTTRPFSLYEINVLNTMKIVDTLTSDDLLLVHRLLGRRNCYIRVGENNRRKIFDCKSIVENFIFLDLGCPLVKPIYFENLKKNMQLWCPFCPSIVSIGCPCSLCVYYRHVKKPYFSTKFEMKGHNIGCTRI